MTEREFQNAVVDMATLYGWMVHHVRPGMTRRGTWLTNVQGHVGFPDLVLVHSGRNSRGKLPAMLPTVIFAELKAGYNKLTEAQNRWAWALQQCPGVNYHMWKPLDMGYIQKVLEGTMQ